MKLPIQELKFDQMIQNQIESPFRIYINPTRGWIWLTLEEVEILKQYPD